MCVRVPRIKYHKPTADSHHLGYYTGDPCCLRLCSGIQPCRTCPVVLPRVMFGSCVVVRLLGIWLHSTLRSASTAYLYLTLVTNVQLGPQLLWWMVLPSETFHQRALWLPILMSLLATISVLIACLSLSCALVTAVTPAELTPWSGYSNPWIPGMLQSPSQMGAFMHIASSSPLY